MIKAELPPDWVYTMLVAPVADKTIKGVTLYLSTMQRPDALQIMREFIATQKEERNWMQEVHTDSLTVEDFDQWWDQQMKRGIESWSVEAAFEGGKAAA